MEFTKHPPEISNPPPEYEVRPELESAAPPPEFGQRTAPAQETEGCRRRLRQLLAVPALLLISFLCFHGVKAVPLPPATEPSVTEAAPSELTSTASAPSESSISETLPVQTATEVPELPEGSVRLDVEYAVLDGDTVRYQYVVDPPAFTPEGVEIEHVTPWPVSIYAQVRDEANRAASPEQEPDVWTEFRERYPDSEIDAAGLEGSLQLTLRAVYTEDGEERQTVVALPVSVLPPAPTLSATLEAFPGGDIDFTATLQPQPGDDHAYDLTVWHMGQTAFSDEETMGFSLGDNPRAFPVTGNRETGYQVHYAGGSVAASLPEGAELSVYVTLKDRSTGYLYRMESNRVSGVPPAEAQYPLGDGTLVITVYNDTLTFDVPSPAPTDDYMTILASDTVSEADFTEYALPSALTPDGYDFTGWVVHVGNPFDKGSDVDLFGDYMGDPPVDLLLREGNYAFPVYGTLTKQDVERIPPSADGNRYVNVHATWIAQNVSDPRLYLDDGSGNVTAYSMDHPAASEGYLYLCNYPIPEREGMTFDGWYDEDGNKVELLVSFFSFTPMVYNEDGSFAGYNWNDSKAVRLVAHWR